MKKLWHEIAGCLVGIDFWTKFALSEQFISQIIKQLNYLHVSTYQTKNSNEHLVSNHLSRMWKRHKIISRQPVQTQIAR